MSLLPRCAAVPVRHRHPARQPPDRSESRRIGQIAGGACRIPRRTGVPPVDRSSPLLCCTVWLARFRLFKEPRFDKGMPIGAKCRLACAAFRHKKSKQHLTKNRPSCTPRVHHAVGDQASTTEEHNCSYLVAVRTELTRATRPIISGFRVAAALTSIPSLRLLDMDARPRLR